ncbi:unnamed protein product, partial [Pleuronectes platessa]
PALYLFLPPAPHHNTFPAVPSSRPLVRAGPGREFETSGLDLQAEETNEELMGWANLDTEV